MLIAVVDVRVGLPVGQLVSRVAQKTGFAQIWLSAVANWRVAYHTASAVAHRSERTEIFEITSIKTRNLYIFENYVGLVNVTYLIIEEIHVPSAFINMSNAEF